MKVAELFAQIALKDGKKVANELKDLKKGVADLAKVFEKETEKIEKSLRGIPKALAKIKAELKSVGQSVETNFNRAGKSLDSFNEKLATTARLSKDIKNIKIKVTGDSSGVSTASGASQTATGTGFVLVGSAVGGALARVKQSARSAGFLPPPRGPQVQGRGQIGYGGKPDIEADFEILKERFQIAMSKMLGLNIPKSGKVQGSGQLGYGGKPDVEGWASYGGGDGGGDGGGGGLGSRAAGEKKKDKKDKEEKEKEGKAEVAKLRESIAWLSSGITKLAASITGLVMGALSMISSSGQRASDLRNYANTTGGSTQFLQEMQYRFTKAGAKPEVARSFMNQVAALKSRFEFTGQGSALTDTLGINMAGKNEDQIAEDIARKSKKWKNKGLINHLGSESGFGGDVMGALSQIDMDQKIPKGAIMSDAQQQRLQKQQERLEQIFIRLNRMMDNFVDQYGNKIINFVQQLLGFLPTLLKLVGMMILGWTALIEVMKDFAVYVAKMFGGAKTTKNVIANATPLDYLKAAVKTMGKVMEGTGLLQELPGNSLGKTFGDSFNATHAPKSVGRGPQSVEENTDVNNTPIGKKGVQNQGKNVTVNINKMVIPDRDAHSTYNIVERGLRTLAPI